MTPDDQYESFLDASLLESTEPATQPTGFQIDSDGKADWALRKLSTLQREEQERAAFVASERARLEDWQTQQDAKAQRFREHLTALLRGYYEQLLAAGKVSERHKTYSLPHGALSMRKGEAKWVRNAGLLLTWADARGLVLVKKEVDWPAIKVRIEADGPEAIDTTTGEIIPGLTLDRASGDVFSAKPTQPTD